MKMNVIKWNRKPFIQLSPSHHVIDPGDLFDDLTIQSLRLTNTDYSMQCKHCGVYFKASEIDYDRCPFCWRLI